MLEVECAQTRRDAFAVLAHRMKCQLRACEPVAMLQPSPPLTDTISIGDRGGRVDYAEARGIGDEAERQVAGELSRLQARHGYFVLHDLLIGKKTPTGYLTAQLDHTLIDQYGVLVIETKARTGARIRGTYSDSKWTAVYPSGKRASFQNPLRQNEQHLTTLHQVLRQAHAELPLDAIRGLVIFVGADVAQLELDSVNRQRVGSLKELSARLEDRTNFPAQAPMDAESTGALFRAIQSLDRSADMEFVNAHIGYRQGRSPQGPEVKGRRSPDRDTPEPFSVTPLQNPARRSPSIARSVLILLLIGFTLVVLWAVMGMVNGTAPSWLWIVAILMIAALGGEEGGGRRRRRRHANQPVTSPSVGTRLLSLVVALGLMCVLLAGGYYLFIQWVSGAAPFSGPAAGAQVSTPIAAIPDVGLAKVRLSQTFPALWPAVSNRDTPQVSPAGAQITYTWQYVQKTSANSATVKNVSVTLDSNGEVVGFSAQ